MAFQFRRLRIPEVMLIEPQTMRDQRGFFLETYRKSEFVANGIADEFVQDNYSHSVRGVLRGLHYQKRPQAQAKLVMVLSGEVFDVSVDIRKGSPTYGQWAGVVLSDRDFRMFYIPEGFAHGFCVLSETADFVYKVTAEYAPALDGGILWSDPAIGIEWPVAEPILSPRDGALPLLHEAEVDFHYREDGTWTSEG
jgi:dTDP-4-dehydrorhamnose 3,5-epimerase